MAANTPDHPGSDAYAPAEIAQRVEAAAVAKVNTHPGRVFVLALLAGAFISFGGMFYTLVMTDHGLGFGPARLLGGLAFSLGLLLVVVAGAELFTGNNLIVMAWADRKISTGAVLQNWFIVLMGNFGASAAAAMMVFVSGTLGMADGKVAATAIAIAEAKTSLPFIEAFVRGVMCNALVCLAVWLCFAARSVTDKAIAVVFPITAFVALGFEHSVANAYLIPVGVLAGAGTVTLGGFLMNMFAVTLGNIVGGGVFVALVYWLIYGAFGPSDKHS